MQQTKLIAKHLRDVHFGGNWTSVNLRDSLAGVSWQEATTALHSLHTIAELVFHINYYARAILEVLSGNELQAHDRYSFNVPAIHSQEAWNELVEQTWADAHALAALIEQLPEEGLNATFAKEQYGSYYRNLHGLIEHTHYHLGQIVLIKKLLAAKA